MKREGNDFFGRVTPLFATMMVQANQEEGVDSGIPTDSQQTPITTQPSSSRPQKNQSRRKQRKETEVPQDETHHDDSVPIPSNDPLLSGEDRMQLTELMILCTNLQKHVLNLEKAKDAQAKEILGLKKRVQKLEWKKKSRTTGLKRLRKVGESRRVESSEDKDNDFHGDEVIVDLAVGEKQEQSAKVDEREVSTSVEDSVAPTIPIVTIDKVDKSILSWRGRKSLVVVDWCDLKSISECVFSKVEPLLIQLTLVTPVGSVIANSIPELLNIDSWYCRRGGKRSEEVGMLQNVYHNLVDWVAL
ncbi:hypothetical protein Tco_0070985 [Tanacetum coccineum]